MNEILLCLGAYILGTSFFFGFFQNRANSFRELMIMSFGWPISVPVRMVIALGRHLG